MSEKDIKRLLLFKSQSIEIKTDPVNELLCVISENLNKRIADYIEKSSFLEEEEEEKNLIDEELDLESISNRVRSRGIGISKIFKQNFNKFKQLKYTLV